MNISFKHRHIFPTLAGILIVVLAALFFRPVDKEKNIKSGLLYNLGCRGNITTVARYQGNQILLQTVITINQLDEKKATLGLYGTLTATAPDGKTIKKLNVFRSIYADFELSNASQFIYSVHNRRMGIDKLDDIDTDIPLASQVLTPLIYKLGSSSAIKIKFLWPNAMLISDLFTPVFVCTINQPDPDAE